LSISGRDYVGGYVDRREFMKIYRLDRHSFGTPKAGVDDLGKARGDLALKKLRERARESMAQDVLEPDERVFYLIKRKDGILWTHLEIVKKRRSR
jgi:hypothetical protein